MQGSLRNMLYKELQKFGQVKSNEPMAKHTTFKIGGPAEFFVTVEETNALIALIQYLNEQGVAWFIVGGGSNMLAGDQGYKGVVIKLKTQNSKVTRLRSHELRRGEETQTKNSKTELFAEAGCITVAIAQLSMQNRLTGFEWGVGVPGTIGGAVRGNAGAMGGEMKDSVAKVTVLRDGEIIELSNPDCKFSYRESIFKHNNDVILSVILQLRPAKNQNSMKQALEYLQYRNKTQPQGFASTGCIFKNYELKSQNSKVTRLRSHEVRRGEETETQNLKLKSDLLLKFPNDTEKINHFFDIGKISVGWLVEKAGMKGVQIGQAKVSETHGNFVVNLGSARAEDVLMLVDAIKQKVYTTCGIQIEEEIQIF